jgi:succinyl-diaminopimelate desuccinylase
VTPAQEDELAGELLDATARLVAVPSLSLHEAELAGAIEQHLSALAHLRVERIGDNVVARTEAGCASRLVIAGHLDTVPGEQGVTRAEGRVTGLGACDMKGGLAVMSWLAATAEQPALDLSFVFYVAEEIASQHSGLGALARERPELLEGDAAVVCEPTGAVLEAGCQGTMQLRVRLAGRRAHTARAWRGVNAIHRLAPLLEILSQYEPRRPEIDGCEYHEGLQAVTVEGGTAGNVVPDSALLRINHRFAPDRSGDEALAHVRAVLAPGIGEDDELEVLDVAPGALPGLSSPLLARLAELVPAPPRAKLGWTDVARFAELGIPAVNFGPGDPELAHTAGEWVEARDLVQVACTLRALVTDAGASSPTG